MKKVNYKLLAVCILVPLILGTIAGLSSSSFISYKEIIKPSFAPPGFIFPIVWTILYILMGISSYLILTDKNKNDKAIKIYIIQLVINIIWPILFFGLKWYFVSFAWLLLLIYAVLQMILEFYPINKAASLLQLPYLLWIIFAGILNLWIYFLN